MINNHYSNIEQAQYKNNIGKKMGYVTTNTDICSIFNPDQAKSASSTSSTTDTMSFQTAGELYFESIAPNASDEVKEAWAAAAEKTGVNGSTQNTNVYMSALFALQAEQRNSTGSGDLLGNTTKSATEAVKKAITKLEGQLENETTNTKVKEYREAELGFYKEFLAQLS